MTVQRWWWRHHPQLSCFAVFVRFCAGGLASPLLLQNSSWCWIVSTSTCVEGHNDVAHVLVRVRLNFSDWAKSARFLTLQLLPHLTLTRLITLLPHLHA